MLKHTIQCKLNECKNVNWINVKNTKLKSKKVVIYDGSDVIYSEWLKVAFKDLSTVVDFIHQMVNEFWKFNLLMLHGDYY